MFQRHAELLPEENIQTCIFTGDGETVTETMIKRLREWRNKQSF